MGEWLWVNEFYHFISSRKHVKIIKSDRIPQPMAYCPLPITCFYLTVTTGQGAFSMTY